MADAREQPAENRPQTGGVVRDLRRLKTDGAASVSELREFVGQMRGRSPQEMLGLIAKSGLTRSIVLATFLFALLLVALTVGPYVWYGGPAASSESAAGEKDASPEEAAAAPEAADEPAAAEATETAGDNGGGVEVPAEAVEALGIGETRTADPDNNPLEDDLDNLLDGIE